MSLTPGRTTGIPKIDKELAELLELPQREVKRVMQIDDDFPGRSIRNENQQTVTIHTVGAGWNLAQNAIAVAAAGAKMIAYDMNKEKIGLGQVGSTRMDDVFDLITVPQVCQLMPTFTPQQLQKLPIIITKITKHPDYERMMNKFDIVKKLLDESGGTLLEKNQKYKSDKKIAKVSKNELISVKNKILQLLKEEGVLQIVHEEITIDDMQSWLDNHEPVLMDPGRQVNLKKMGLDHLDMTPGFLKEFMLKSPETEGLIKMISKMQTDYENKQRSTRPSIAFIGGGTSSSACAMDLLERVQPKIVSISPEGKTTDQSELVKQAERSMNYEYIRGYISDLAISQSEQRIDSAKVFNFRHGKEQDPIQCDLLVHLCDQTQHSMNYLSGDTETSAFIKATEQVTDLLDAKNLTNGLVRYKMFVPGGIDNKLVRRITTPWLVSLEYDEVLKREIRNLVKLQDDKDVTFVVTGEGRLAEAVKVLAVSLGYHGRFIRIAVESRDRQELVSEIELRRVKNEDDWVYIKGRLVQDGTTFQNGNFTLGVCNEKGEKIQEVPTVDAIINAAGKTARSPLIEAMLEKGYIVKNEHDRLVPTISTLAAGNGVFNAIPKIRQETSPHITFHPLYEHRVYSKPLGWKEIFDFAREMIKSSSKPI